MLCCTIAMTIVAIEVYIITDILPMKRHEQVVINATITIGYLTSAIFGMHFAYWGQNFYIPRTFPAGPIAGLLRRNSAGGGVIGVEERARRLRALAAAAAGGVDLEQVAFFTMAIATLLASAFGAVTGSYWGNGHETFLAEDLIRTPLKTGLQRAIIGHLHIMLTLIAIGITLIVGRWMEFKGRLHKVAMILMIIGTIVIGTLRGLVRGVGRMGARDHLRRLGLCDAGRAALRHLLLAA